MENGLSFMPNYLQMGSYFVHGSIFNQKESRIFWKFASIAGFVNFHVGTIRLHKYSPLEHLMEVVLITLLSELIRVSNQKSVLSKTIWS